MEEAACQRLLEAAEVAFGHCGPFLPPVAADGALLMV